MSIARLSLAVVSDVACPWCAIGVNALDRALQSLRGEIEADVVYEPFELNPSMGPEGQDAVAYLTAKYGITAEQVGRTRQTLAQRGAEVGFVFGERHRVWNTFDAHRLLAWAGREGPPGAQHRLKLALLKAYHTHGENPAAPEVLQREAEASGLDAAAAAAVIAGDAEAAAVREREAGWQRLGISAVPSVVVNMRHLIQGGQPVAAYAQALREIAAG